MIKEQLSVNDKIALGMKKGMESGLEIKSNFRIELFDENGKLKEVREVHNTVTTAGKNGIADQVLASPSLSKIGWLAIGTGSPSATLLGAEVARVAFDTKTRSNAVVTVVATFAAGTGTGAITEAGTFDVVTANTVNMWMSSSFSVVNKGALDSMVVTWTLTVS
jgi:hypothetical protein